MKRHYLQALFAPASVALAGASDRAGSLGRYVLENIQKSGFQGAIHPVNPRHNMLAGLRCVAGLGDIGSAVDLVVVTTPAAAVFRILAIFRALVHSRRRRRGSRSIHIAQGIRSW
jgi:acetyltransferase